MPSAAEHFSAATAARASGDLVASHASYAAAIKMAPTMLEAYLNVGWVLSELDRPKEAVASYQFALQHRAWPGDTGAAAHNNLGVLFRDLSRHAEAKAAWKKSLHIKPDFGPAIDNLAQAAAGAAASPGESFVRLINDANEHLSRAAYEEAATQYRHAMPLRDARADGSAYVGLGAALHASGRLSEAVHVLAAGAKINPASPGMLMNLAIVRTDLQQWKGAASAWRKALAIRPNDAQAYRAAFAPTKRAKGSAAALPLLAAAARLAPNNWHYHYTNAHALLHEAYSTPTTTSEPDAALASAALQALQPLHRLPISLAMRASDGAEPPWTRFNGLGLVGDQPQPKSLPDIWDQQAEHRRLAASVGPQKGIIVYKLGPKESEVDHLRLSLRLLMRHHNSAFRYPILIAHDEPLGPVVRAELTAIAKGVRLSFVKLHVELPRHLSAGSVPETVLGFPVAYRHMIRWKVGQLWLMPELSSYEYVWSLDTDAFIVAPLTYDVFGLMKAKQATYGYVDVNVETPEVADGLGECVDDFLRRRPALHQTMLNDFRSGARRRWDGSKFYTNFQVARLDFGQSDAFRDLFKHIDEDGGIYRHRWGADPILFLAVHLFLSRADVVHFADVPYVHQHLVANLPASVAETLALPTGFQMSPAAASEGEPGEERGEVPGEAPAGAAAGAAAMRDTCSTPTDDSVGCAGRATAGGLPRVLLFVTGASHAAAAADALKRWAQATSCLAPGRHQSSPRLQVEVCSAGPMTPQEVELVQGLVRGLPSAIRFDGDVAQCGQRSQRLRATVLSDAAEATESADTAAAAAAESLLQVSATLHASTPQLLVACIDVSDGRTLAAGLAARLAQVSVLNVCDFPLSADEGLLVRPTSDLAADPSDPDALYLGLLDGAAGCGAPEDQGGAGL